MLSTFSTNFCTYKHSFCSSYVCWGVNIYTSMIVNCMSVYLLTGGSWRYVECTKASEWCYAHVHVGRLWCKPTTLPQPTSTSSVYCLLSTCTELTPRCTRLSLSKLLGQVWIGLPYMLYVFYITQPETYKYESLSFLPQSDVTLSFVMWAPLSPPTKECDNILPMSEQILMIFCILWMCRLWPGLQVITFLWQSQITICITNFLHRCIVGDTL